MPAPALNPEQRQAVNHMEGPLMILAGAGTGKTKVITTRMARMISHGIDPKAIVAMTFTNKAAREMAERLGGMLGPGQRKRPTVGTFHSFCLIIIRRFYGELGLDKDFKLAGTAEQLDLIRRVLEEKGWQKLYRPDQLLSRISSAKMNMLSPEELLTAPMADEDKALLAEVYHHYQKQLSLHRFIDFDDCIYLVVKLLRRSADSLEALQQRYRYFLVDEFQDTNLSQLEIIKLLGAASQNVCVVGDDDQSIYSWRGAMMKVLTEFERFFPETTLIKLEQNYRCTQPILDAANHVIRNNQHRKDKTLWSASESADRVVIAAKEDDQAEARWIAGKILSRLGSEEFTAGGLSAKDIAILYRTNSQARALEIAMREHKIPYKVFGGSSFFEKKEIKDALCYLKLTIDPADRYSLWRVVNVPPRGIGIKTLEKIDALATEAAMTPYDFIAKATKGQDALSLGDPSAASLAQSLGPKLTKTLGKFVDKLATIAQMPLIEPADISARLKIISKEFGLENDIRLKTSHESSRQKKLSALAKLPEWLETAASHWQSASGEGEAFDSAGFLDMLTLSEESRNSDQGDLDAVSLMTIHASKGLEFHHVFVCGLEEGLLPHKNSLDQPSAVFEERRLLYVAITRAKKRLFLSLAKERFLNFTKEPRKPSRFIRELPKSEIIAEDGYFGDLFTTKATSKASNVARFKQLRAFLAENGS